MKFNPSKKFQSQLQYKFEQFAARNGTPVYRRLAYRVASYYRSNIFTWEIHDFQERVVENSV